jgi:hypothetical protein
MKRSKKLTKATTTEATSIELVDLSRYDALQQNQEAGLDIEIRDPSGKKLGFSIRVAGPDSTRQRKAVEKMAADRMASEDPTPLTPAELYDRQTRGLAIATLSWSPFKLDGGIYELTENSAYALYNRFPFIRDQVNERAGRRSAFFESSNTESGAQ